ncbi:hypothetical protein Sjap_009361 [Stephania japonica]|uniref:Uncharacterized protein n=1 Tax=Stephania japonica TaxID=461633 RepID=A0AAP0JTN7_9MAGN
MTSPTSPFSSQPTTHHHHHHPRHRPGRPGHGELPLHHRRLRGFSLTVPGQRSLEQTPRCDADADHARRLLVFEIISFTFFLFSSLIAQGLKLALNLLNSKDADEIFRAHINLNVLRFGMLGSAAGSVLGCVFLMMSIVDVIEIRLGVLSCGSGSAVRAVAVMVGLVSSALLGYISTVVYAFTRK